MTRYTIDERNTTAETSLNLYRAAVKWAAQRGNRFEMRLERRLYSDMDKLNRLIALGETTPAPAEKVFGESSWPVFVKGIPGADLARELTNSCAPADDLSGDVSPAEDLSIYWNERRIYAAFDYGSTQLFELTDDELGSLRETFAAEGLNTAYLVPAPEAHKV
jgi:hypothetical protein